VLNVTNKAFHRAIVLPGTFHEPYLTSDALADEFTHKEFYLCELEG